MLMAADLPVPEHVFVHGFLMGEDGRKMSKSLGNVLDPFEVLESFGTDALRFYLTREVVFGSDGNVGPHGLQIRYETELANEYGNLASRTGAMIARYRDGVLPTGATDPVLGAEFAGLRQGVVELFDRFELTLALDLIWERVRRLNRYVEERSPWVLARDPERAEELDVVLRSLFEGLRIVTILLHPYVPETTDRLLAAMQLTDKHLAIAEWRDHAGGTMGVLEPLFPKRD
jgi:methionyl-tRNA synthetase